MQTPFPILFLDHASAIGGAEQSLVLILQHINRDIWTPYLVCSNDSLANNANSFGVRVHRITFPRLRGNPNLVEWFQSVWNLKGVIDSVKPALIVANTLRSVLYGLVASRLTRIPFIWYMRDFWISEEEPENVWFDELTKKLICNFATSVIVNSQATAEHLPNTTKIIVIHNGIDVNSFDPLVSDDTFRQRLNIPRDQFVIGMMGRLRPWKGQDRFIRVASRIIDKHPDAKFLIIGGDIFGVEDQYTQELHSMVDQMGLKDRVVFTGHMDDIVPALAAMDIFVHPGDPEPFGLVNIEAMAMAKPIVAFAHGALPEIVIDNRTGILVEPLNETAMAEAIMGLLEDSNKRANMGRLGRERVLEKFNAQRMASQVEDILKGVIHPH